MMIFPEYVVSKPDIISIMVLLPVPVGPIMPILSPELIFKLNFLNIFFFELYPKVIFFNSNFFSKFTFLNNLNLFNE